MTKKNVAIVAAESLVVNRLNYVERQRKLRGISMRALAAAAGLRPTSYWGIVRTPKNMAAVKASTLFALEEAVDLFPSG